MTERYSPRVQHEALPLAPSIYRVADDWMTDVAQVNADLVCTPGAGVDSEHGPLILSSQYVELCLRRAPLGVDRHPARSGWVAPDRSVDQAFCL